MTRSIPILLSYLIIPYVVLVEAKTVRHTFQVSYIKGNPDGVHVGHIIGINGNFPGPTIYGDVGDILEVLVLNTLQDRENVTIHWHGFHQRKTPFDDGPSMITQCPIKDGSWQMYTFELDKPGTYWYHSHVQSQYTAGLWGAIVVRNIPELYPYDDEIVITLSDWYHNSYLRNEKWYLGNGTLGSVESPGPPPIPDSVLINGMGRYPCNFAENKSISCDPLAQMRPVFTVANGKRYRIRVINVSGITSFDFSVEGHYLNAIEMDSVDTSTKPSEVALIAPAQRYSFILTPVKIQEPVVSGSYLIRAVTRIDFLPNSTLNINPYPEALQGPKWRTLSAMLTYVDPPTLGDKNLLVSKHPYDYTQDPSIPDDAKPLFMLNENDHIPLDFSDFVHNHQVQETLVVTVTVGREEVGGPSRFSFNNMPFHLPDKGKPLLSRMLDGDNLWDHSIYPTLRTYNLSYNIGFELVVNNPVGTHPLHLHGHHFWVVRFGEVNDGNYNPEVHDLTRHANFKRDTILVRNRSFVVLRWFTDNPGFWTFHCHIDWHMVSGMVINFAEAPDEARKRISTPPQAKRLCGEHGITI